MADHGAGSAPLNQRTLTDADFRLMVDSVTDYAIIVLDPGGIVISWNEGARKLKGYDAPEILGRHFSLFYPTELLEQNRPEHALETARRDGRMEEEGWRLRSDGTRFWASVVITRITGSGGETRGFSLITRDRSENRRQDEMLRMSEERFRLLVEGVKDYAIFMLDPGGHIVSWNLGAQKNKGYEASEIIGQHFSRFYPPEVAASGWPEQELRNALRDGRFEDEGWRIRKDGSRFWASVVITALHDATGRHRGFAKVTRDLTERRRVTALEDEGRRVTNFLAMLGHELRNPLAPISNALELLKREKTESAAVVHTRDIIGRQLRQMTRLVDDLLDVGRITSGKIQLENKPVRLRDAIAEAIEAVRPLIDGKSQTLHLQMQDADPWIAGDSARVIQIVSNLVHNAAKFAGNGGNIHVSLSRSAADADISVRDDGPGIPPQDLQRIFDLFVQGEQNLARTQGGLGLGLSLVQQLTTLHGGRVSAFSTGRPGEGSEFVVQFPTTQAPVAMLEAQPRPVGEQRVLVVDDNVDAAETMAMLLEALGYKPSVVHGGLAAIEAVKAQDPDVVLLDIGLPDLSGHEVARRVRAEMVNPPPLIAVTGYGQASDRDTSLEAGFRAHLTKPVDVDKLSALLEHLLEPPRFKAA
ncbi:PAS/PAC sensor hybrid histidine kinase [Variovorax beijingensis]|uniref:histidine kinase n=1 Tax=Variovorax beijingensis TaxID=2496117 RepID=A0A561C837_9BURK|nr:MULTISPECIES: PAS domain S-box protein [Variovorax]MBD9666588.1 PAS domain S-box protein [Variovorax sp. VRV01]MDP9966540.1 PAS domain S-box-containing protein [Variovorax paradoxus]TWD87187.1 PAS/PAC sensor hybrid histidine kinase [Variovorax beijingensis]